MRVQFPTRYLLFVLAICTLAVRTLSAPCSGFVFRNTPTIPVGTPPYQTLAADFDGDGLSDPVAVNSNSTITVFRNLGGGRFADGIAFSVGSSPPQAAAAADFDGDGRIDIAYSNSSQFVGILRNTGSGSLNFESLWAFAVGSEPKSMIASDFDGDSRIDIATANYGSRTLSVLRNTGSGSIAFAPKVDFTTGNQPFAIAATDLNSDTRLDIAVVNNLGSTVSIFRNISGGQGEITFAVRSDFSLGSSPRGIAAGDFDGDGRPDLVTTASFDASINVLRNTTTDPLNVTFATRVNFPVNTGPIPVVASDFDGDGRIDIAAANNNASVISVLRNTSSGAGNVAFATKTEFGTGYGPYSMTVADLDADGKPDLATSEFQGQTITVLRNTSTAPGAIAFIARREYASGSGAFSVVSADFDLDGSYDLAVANTSTLSAFRNDGRGAFPTRTSLSAGAIGDLALGDFNLDGKSDIVFTEPSQGYGAVFLNTSSSGTMSFGPPRALYLGEIPIGVTVADLDGNSTPDFAVAASALGWNKVGVALNNGDGTFSFGGSFAVGGQPKRVASGDFDGDGKIDLVSLNVYSNDLTVLRNTGTQPGSVGFDATTLAPGFFDMRSIGAGDFDGDGKLDLAISSGGYVRFLRNNASGPGVITFAPPVSFAGGGDPRSVVVTDFDRDGKLDVVTSNDGAYNKGLIVFRNQSHSPGSILFANGLGTPMGGGESLAAVADFDNNGLNDLASAGFGNVSVVPSDCASVRRAPFDFDGDGRTDISIFRPSNGQWWLDGSGSGLIVHTFGNSSDIPSPGDLTGDGKIDVAVFRPGTGHWFILRSENFSFYSFPFGAPGDVPVPADYDGDGKTDAAVFRPDDSTWYVQRSRGGTTIRRFGVPGDRPVPADFDGDGKADIAVFRPDLGQWWIERSSAGTVAFTFGNAGDRTVPGDYTGDALADIAIWRPSSREWFILRSEDSTFFSFLFGSQGDIPSPGDFDGDGRFDAAVFRPTSGVWYVQLSTAGLMIKEFGSSSDVPVPSAFVR